MPDVGAVEDRPAIGSDRIHVAPVAGNRLVRQGPGTYVVQVPPRAHLPLNASQAVVTVIALDGPLLTGSDVVPGCRRRLVDTCPVGVAVDLGTAVGGVGQPAGRFRPPCHVVHPVCVKRKSGDIIKGIYRRGMALVALEVETAKTAAGIVHMGSMTFGGNRIG